MATFVRRRLLTGLITVLGVIVVTFFLARLTGSPAGLYLPQGASEERFEQFNRKYGFDQPILVQFVRFLEGVVRLDFGDSIWQQRPALEAALHAMPPTLILAAIALVLSVVVSLVLGSLAASHRFRTLDRIITFGALTSASIPDFWFALVGVLLLAVQLEILPTSGYQPASAWILPVATLMIAPVGVLVQVTRGAMIEAIGSGYVQNARARGFSNSRLVYRHALRNAAIPIISVAGDRAAGMINGAIIVSAVFAFPGMGALVVGAVLNRDFAVLQASVFVVGIAVVLLNVIVDIAYAMADPRVRLR